MRLSKFQGIYLALITTLIVVFFGINFQGILKAHVDIGVAAYILTVNSLAIMAFFYMNNTENFKKNDIAGLKNAYKKEAPSHLFFALIVGMAIYVLQYVLSFTLYCPPGAQACVLASARYDILTWIAVIGVVFVGVCVSFILIAISFILAIYVPITMILKKKPKKNL